MPARSAETLEVRRRHHFGLNRLLPLRTSARSSLQSEVRRMSVGHDVTESAEIRGIWAGVKHALLFTVSYTGQRR